MLELLLAILLALGFNYNSSLTEAEIREKDPVAYEQALKIQQSGNYKTVDGGVVIVEVGGDW